MYVSANLHIKIHRSLHSWICVADWLRLLYISQTFTPSVSIKPLTSCPRVTHPGINLNPVGGEPAALRKPQHWCKDWPSIYLNQRRTICVCVCVCVCVLDLYLKFHFRHSFCHITAMPWLAKCTWCRKSTSRRKPPSNPKSLMTFSHAPGGTQFKTVVRDS